MHKLRKPRLGWHSAGALALALLACGAVSAGAHAQEAPIVSGYGRYIQFAGYEWRAKVSNVRVGPGPNFFSDTADAVWVDNLDRLHLRVGQDAAGRWQAAEVVMQPSLGYGTYRFYLDPAPRPLDPTVVLGMFTWNDDPTQNHREMDVEVAQWGNPAIPNGRYSIQPFELVDRMFSFDAGHLDTATTHALQWQSGCAAFVSWRGSDQTPADDALVAGHVFVNGVPESGGEQIRMNLWLDQGLPPASGDAVEVIVRGFEFIPQTIQSACEVDGTDAPAA